MFTGFFFVGEELLCLQWQKQLSSSPQRQRVSRQQTISSKIYQLRRGQIILALQISDVQNAVWSPSLSQSLSACLLRPSTACSDFPTQTPCICRYVQLSWTNWETNVDLIGNKTATFWDSKKIHETFQDLILCSATSWSVRWRTALRACVWKIPKQIQGPWIPHFWSTMTDDRW